MQSDFITQANREDILESAWNDELLKGVASSFCEAVAAFSDDHALQYGWMHFLPRADIYDTFWRRLLPEIKTRLSEIPLVQTWNNKKLVKIREARIILPQLRDENGEPLFEDFHSPVYLAAVSLSLAPLRKSLT